MRKIPDEFKRFTRCFWQGSDEEAASETEWIAKALQLNSTGQRIVIKQFLTDLLSGNADGAELQRIWNSGGPNYGFSNDDDLRSFLERVRDMIA